MNKRIEPSKRHHSIRATVTCAVACVLLLGPLSWAADRDRSGYLEEIIVTGTKRATSQQDTPIAVSTLTARDIANTFVNDVRAVADLSPNVLLTKQPGFNALSGGIRGTGSTSILVLQDTSVGISIDDFVISSVQSQFVELFDVEQIEIYRGPQGTLFGKNSTAGVIAITSKRPSMEEFGGEVELTFGQFDVPGGNTDIAKIGVAVDVPLIEDTLAFRFAGVYDTYEGYMRNGKDTATFPDNIPWFGILDPPDPITGLTPLEQLGFPRLVDSPLPDLVSGPARGDGKIVDGKNVLAWKAKLLWQPTERYEAYFTWEYMRDDSDPVVNVHESPEGEGFLHPIFGFPAIGPGDSPYNTGVTDSVGNEHTVHSDGYYLTQTLALDTVELKLIAGWRETEETLSSNYTGEAFVLFDASRNLEREQGQIELRAITNFDGPVNFVAGAAYFTDDVDFHSISFQGFSAFFLSPHPDTGTLLDPDGVVNFDTDWITDGGLGNRTQERETFAFYLDGTYELNEQFSLSAGIRYTKDEKDFGALSGGGAPCNGNPATRPVDMVPADATLPFDPVTNCLDVASSRLSRAGLTIDQYNPQENPLPPEQYTLVLDLSEEWDEVSWRVVLDYAINDDQLIYGSVATGYISGGFTETCSTVITCVPYEAETNINYEIGYKADFLDRTLRINVAAFYSDFDDIQRNQVVPFTNAAGTPAQETLTVNAGKSHVYGLEVEATWLATDNLTLKAAVGILEAKYDEFEFDPQPNNPDTSVVDFSGLDIPFASPLQINFDATYEIPLAGGGSLRLNGSVNFQDAAETSPFDSLAAGGGSFLAPRDSVVVRQPTNTEIEKRTLVHANATWRDADERYYVTLYGRNLTNKVKRVGANSVAFLWNFTVYAPPREFGVRIGVNFN